jgi:hypothetical protein
LRISSAERFFLCASFDGLRSFGLLFWHETIFPRIK